MRNDFVYDIETYPNVFTLAVEHADAPLRWLFEISDRRNDSSEICQFIYWLKDINARMVGFNNLGFDYPILHTLIKMGRGDAPTLYAKAQAIMPMPATWVTMAPSGAMARAPSVEATISMPGPPSKLPSIKIQAPRPNRPELSTN